VACGLVLGLVLMLGPTAPGTAAAAPPATDLGGVVISTLGPGYAATPRGPLDPSAFSSNAPNPSAAAAALSTLPASVATDERVWQADGGLNQVRDLLVRFPNVAGARAFLHVAQHSLESGEIVDSNAVPSIPGARRVIYFAPTKQGGVGEAITMRAGVYVDLLSFFSAASGNARPIAPANAEKAARAQYAAMVKAPGGTSAQSPVGDDRKGVSSGAIGLAVVAVAILALAVATPVLLRRRREATPTDAAVVGSAAPAAVDASGGHASGGHAVHDLREHPR
jgi:hypothetical protein